MPSNLFLTMLKTFLCICVAVSSQLHAADKPTLKPAVGVEAEQFDYSSEWKVIRVGEGSYTSDIIGFCHMSGERLLSIDKAATTGEASKTVDAPFAGPYRLWVRYEYPPFCETRFKVIVEQDGKEIASKVMGIKDAKRLQFNNPNLIEQYDPPWGSEGTAEEPLDVPHLEAGPVKLILRPVEQPQTPGVAANRNIDLLYLTSDVSPITLEDGKLNPESWYAIGGGPRALYPILNAFRNTVGARWQVTIKNTSDQPTTYTWRYIYNRNPWYPRSNKKVTLQQGETSEPQTLDLQDTVHFSAVFLTNKQKHPFDVTFTPVAGGKSYTFASDAGTVRVYVPPYPVWGESPRTPMDAIDDTLALLEKTEAPGREPTLPLTYGWTIPVWEDGAYGEKYLRLYKALGMRSLPSHSHPPTIQKSIDRLESVGIPATRSSMVALYRNPPLPEFIEKGKKKVVDADLLDLVRFYDYGDEISFTEWIGHTIKFKSAETGKDAQTLKAELWRDWLNKHRPGYDPADYWLDDWGKLDPANLKPDSNGKTANDKPRLYVDSLHFYEETSIDFVAERAKVVKEEFGDEVLSGANYSCHPFYYPEQAMYVDWFRKGAADFGRHSEYFWQVSQAGPMINGYIAEHFRAGMRFNDNAVLKQYTMPHVPGNTDANFRRTAFTHMAHGAKLVDYFGMGFNETFTENHIDHRRPDRYQAIRDVNYSIGLVEDLMMDNKAVNTKVGILLSGSTEAWDLVPITVDMARRNVFDANNFRKVRMSYHLERVGLWKALTFAGSSPDLLVEDDLTNGVLDEYQLLFVVGDCLPENTVAAMQKWVEQGGTIVATAGAGRFDEYRQPATKLNELLGIQSRELTEHQRFFRVRQELPFLSPVGKIDTGSSKTFPAIAIEEKVTPTEGATITSIDPMRDAPMGFTRKVGKGTVHYIAGLPGVAYLWAALQPPLVPDRAANTHAVPQNFDKTVTSLVDRWLKSAGVKPTLITQPALIDGRLLQSGDSFFLPLANYQTPVGQPVKLRIRTGKPVSKVISAVHGELKFDQKDGVVMTTVPGLGYGDVLRLE